MTYPLDVTGTSIENKILGDVVSIIASPSTYHRVVPLTGPFYEDGCIVRYTPSSGAYRTLIPGTDYYLGYQYVDASVKADMMVYGAIVLNDSTLNGTITYSVQTLGGAYELNVQQVNAIMQGEYRDPAVTSWEQVCTSRGIVLAAFPEVDYSYTRATSSQFRALTDTLEQAGLAIHLRPKFLPNPGDAQFIPSASEIGLGNIDNFKTATLAQAAAGVAEDLYVTPAGVNACVSEQVGLQLAALGYSTPINYIGSLSVNDTVKTYLFEGDVWVAKAGSIPFTTTGVFEYDKFVLVNANTRDTWQSISYTVTGNESRGALNDVLINIGTEIKASVKTRMVINDIIETARDVDYRLDGNSLLVIYPLQVGDTILFRFKQLKSRAADMRGYYKAFVITNTAASLTLAGFAGINPADVEVKLNDFIVLNPHRGDYTIVAGVLTIAYPLEVGDTIEVQDIDSVTVMGVQALRSVLFAMR